MITSHKSNQVNQVKLFYLINQSCGQFKKITLMKLMKYQMINLVINNKEQ